MDPTSSNTQSSSPPPPPRQPQARENLSFWRKFFPDRHNVHDVKDQFGQFEFSKEAFRRSMKKAKVHIFRAGVLGFTGMAVLSGVIVMLMGIPSKKTIDKLEILHYENTLEHARDRKKKMLEGRVHEMPPDDIRMREDLIALREMENMQNQRNEKQM